MAESPTIAEAPAQGAESAPDLRVADCYRAYEEAISEFYRADGEVREPVDYVALEQRLGKTVLLNRLERQVAYVERGLGHGVGMLKFGPLVEELHILSLCLRMSGLLGRGRENAGALKVEENMVHLPQLPKELDGLRILQLADLHFECDPALTDVLIHTFRELPFDLCLITGDYRYLTYGPHEPSMRELSRVVEQLNVPTLGVLGNHDAIEMVPAAERMGMTMLVNEGVSLPIRGSSLFIAGVEDDHYYRGANVRQSLQDRSNDQDVTVLMSHSSETYEEAEGCGVDLLVSGHTHGGQICLPGGFPVLNNARSPRRMVSGAWNHGALQGYTSRGSGCVSTPVRFNCPPEITVHTLRLGEG